MTGNGNGNERRRFIKDLREGDAVKGTYAVRSKEPPREYRSKSGKFFFFKVGDRTGDLEVKFWGGNDPKLTEEVYKSFKPGDVIQISGTVQDDKFEDKIVIIMNEDANVLRPTTGEVRPEDYLAASPMDLDVLMERIMEAVASVEEPHLKALLDSFFNDQDFVKEFRGIPSAIVHHHNYLGGNLEHVVGVLEVSEALCRTYKELDRDLLVTGALLHDIGKMRTYSYTTFIDHTDEGKFMGHTILGERMVRARIDTIEGFPRELAMKLCHMVLKHMGSWEDPTGMRGFRTLEAVALHLADNSDAQVKEFLQDRHRGRELESGSWYYSRSFKGPIYLK
jgi:3'-5' exoribonuclease